MSQIIETDEGEAEVKVGNLHLLRLFGHHPGTAEVVQDPDRSLDHPPVHPEPTPVFGPPLGQFRVGPRVP